MEEKMIVEFDFLEDDFKRFWKFIAWDSPEMKGKRQRNKIYTLCALAFIIAFIIHIDEGEFNEGFLIKFSIFSVLIFIPIMLNGNYHHGKIYFKAALKYLKLPENKNILGKRILEFNSVNILAKVYTGETIYQWNAITKIVISDFDYYLHVTSESAIVIPQRVFNNESKLAFENLLKSKTEVIDFRK